MIEKGTCAVVENVFFHLEGQIKYCLGDMAVSAGRILAGA